jgi:hypothetical protein
MTCDFQVGCGRSLCALPEADIEFASVDSRLPVVEIDLENHSALRCGVPPSSK